MQTQYEQQAQDFLNKTNTKISTKFICYDKHFSDDDQPRDIYEVTIEREGRKPFTFRFGQSIMFSSGYVEKCAQQRLDRGEPARKVAAYKKSAIKHPSSYDILSALTKSDPETFDDFCANFGYSNDSRKAERIYFAAQKEWREVNRIFGDVLVELQDIN